MLDFDGDGDDDLLTTRPTAAPDSPGISVYLRRPGGFELATLASPLRELGAVYGIVSTDIDGNGLADLFLTHPDRYTLLLRKGDDWIDASATWLPANPPLRRWPSVGDFDGDGRVDIEVHATETTAPEKPTAAPIRLFQRHRGQYTLEDASPNSTFYLQQPVELTPAAASWSLGDVSGDGIADLFAATHDVGAPICRLGTGDKLGIDTAPLNGMAEAPGARGLAACLADLDNDGDLDALQTISQAKSPLQLFLNSGTGHFREVSRFFADLSKTTDRYHSVACADFDGDGRLDLAFSRADAPVVLFHNRLERRHWLAVELKPKSADTTTLGAVVRIHCGNWRSTRWAIPDGPRSSRTATLHFGLGEHTSVDRLVIQWPGGHVDEHTAVVIGQTYVATEGALTPR